LKKYIYVGLVFIFSSCSTLKPVRDPWNEKYIHHSGKYELIFDHFGKNMVEVNTFEVPRSATERPRMSFFAEIKENKLVYQAMREPDCRIEFSKIDEGIMVDEHCHGTGEDVGLYRPKTKIE
jgi:hypothetical protein